MGNAMAVNLKNVYAGVVQKIMYTVFSQQLTKDSGFVDYPEEVIINTVEKCNLSCVFCPLGQNLYKPVVEVMDFNTFQIIFNKIRFVKQIGFFNWGEPFLNPYLFDMIRLSKKYHKKTVVHSNFNLHRDSHFFNNIISSGLDELSISCDGASQESYGKYHKNGNFDLVMSNVKKLRDLQKKNKKELPKITWKFLVNRYNEHEFQSAQNLADFMDIDLKFDFFRLAEDLPDMYKKFGNIRDKKKKWLPRKNKDYVHPVYAKKGLYPLFEEPCPSLFLMFAVNTDGSIFPCCYVSEHANVFGSLITNSFDEIWNNRKYRYSRNLFKNNGYNGQKVYTICEKCGNYQKVVRSI
jgi:radical SAM protein with 4Fe4S-binding SPASM domain